VYDLPELDYTDLLDKPFKLGARGPDKYDCWGLCLEIGKRVGIDYPLFFTPTETEEQDQAIKVVSESLFEEIDKPEPYCIATFRIHPPFVDHCGIVLFDTFYFLHTITNHRVVRQRLDVYNKRLYGFYKLKISGISTKDIECN